MSASSASSASTPLKVSHVVLSLDVGGMERIVVELVHAGMRLGQRVSVLCIERPGVLAPEAEQLGARVYCADKPAGLRPTLVRKLAKALSEIRPDVVHTHQIGALAYAGPASKLARIPVVVHTEHGKHYGTRWQTRLLGRWGGRFVKRFFCVSRDIATEVIDRRIVPLGKVVVIPNGIDTGKFRTPADGEPTAVRSSLGMSVTAKVIGTIGRLSEVKRQDILIRAFALVHEHNPDARLLLVGDGPLMSDLRKLSKEQDLDGAVHFAGYQSQPERFLHAMDVFALTSRSEGMPLVILETWAAGVPVVASAVGGLPELIQDGQTGLLFPYEDERSLAQKLITVLSQSELRQRLTTTASQRVEAEFTIQKTAMNYQNAYLEQLAIVGGMR